MWYVGVPLPAAMGRGEVVTLQVGRFANYVGSHAWNLQDEAFGRVAAADGGTATHGGEAWRALDGDATWAQRASGAWAPRVLVVDAAAHLGAMPAAGGDAVAADAFAATRAAEEVMHAATDVVAAWDGRIERREAERITPSPFVAALYSERELEPTEEDEDEEDDYDDYDENENGGGIRPRGGGQQRRVAPSAEEAAALEAQDEAVANELESAAAQLDGGEAQGGARYWSDFLKTPLGSRSVVALRGVDSAAAAGGGSWRAAGSALWCSDGELRDSLEDGVRRLVEECDAPQGFVLLAEEGTGMAGLADELRGLLADDYGSRAAVTFAAQSPDVPFVEEADAGGMGERRRVSAAMGLAAAARASDCRGTYVPLAMAPSISGATHALGFDATSEYRAAAAMAALVDTATLPARCHTSTPARPYAAGDLFDLDALCRGLHPQGPQLAAASLALPLGAQPADTAQALADEMLEERQRGCEPRLRERCKAWLASFAPLSAQLGAPIAGADMNAVAEAMTLRGWEGHGSVAPARRAHEVLASSATLAWPTARRLYAATSAPLPLPLPFPTLASGGASGVARAASHLSAGAMLAPALRTAAAELRRASRSATMMPLMASSGLSAFDLEEAVDALSAASDDFGTFDDEFD